MSRPHLVQRTFLHLDGLVNTNSCDFAAVEGHLDLDRLRRALDAAVARHPLARSRLGPDGWEIGAAPPIELAVEALPDDTLARAVDAAAAHAWSERLDLAVSAPVRARVLRGPRRDHLLLIGPHATTDARSGARLMEDVARAYTALATGGRASFPVVPLPILPAPTAVDLLRAALAILRDVLTPGAGLSAVDAPRGTPRVALMDLGAPLLEDLRAAARARGLTVHALVLLALHRARARREAHGALARTPLRILDLVSLRPLLPGTEDAWDVLVAPHTLTLPADEAKVLAAAQRKLAALKAGAARVELARLAIYDCLARWVPLRLAAGLVFRFITRTNLVLTNPGPVPWPIARFGALPVVEFFSFPSPMPPARAGLSLTTWQGRLRLVVLHDPAAFPSGLDDLVAPFVEALRDLAAAGLTRAVRPGRSAPRSA